MYPHHSSSSSSSSSSQTGTGLTRYGSAPSSLLNSTVEAVLAAGGSRLLPPGGGGGAQAHYYSSSGDSSSDTTCKEHNIRSSPTSYHHDAFLNSAGSASLLRQKSSPAGFLSHNHNHNHNHNSNLNAGFTITRGSSHSHSHSQSQGGGGGSRLKSELSFTAQGQECLSRISENLVVDASTSYGTQHQPWGGRGQDGDNSIVFSAPPKRSKTNDPDFLTALDSQFSMPQTTLEMAAVENMLHIPQDSVPCKIRAKRGCATHPRSIAERERRTRISGKLKKLQDLVPNMDKQTSYADMLDLAVQHIKGLQGQVQKLHTELENCTCGCKQST